MGSDDSGLCYALVKDKGGFDFGGGKSVTGHTGFVSIGTESHKICPLDHI